MPNSWHQRFGGAMSRKVESGIMIVTKKMLICRKASRQIRGMPLLGGFDLFMVV